MSNGTIETKDTTPYSPDWGQEAAMNTSPVKSEEHTLDVTTGGSIAQSLGGLAAIVLAIVGLVHICPALYGCDCVFDDRRRSDLSGR